LRMQLERRHALARQRLHRAAILNGITIAGLGAAAAALVWRFAPQLEQLPAFDPMLIVVGTLVVLAAGLWPLLAKKGTHLF
ncbi:MAG: hypothetical protein ACRENW_07435, partial [Thermodesulfobacteriota bacterium]